MRRKGVERPVEPILAPFGHHVENQIDARAILGCSATEAELLLARHGCTLRVLELDGEQVKGVLITDDVHSNRVNVALKGDVVVGIVGVY